MSYTKTNWVNNITPIDKNNLNKIEQGIYDNSLVVDAVTNTLNPTDTETYKTASLTEGQITDVIGVNDIVIKGDTEQDGTPTPSAPVDVNVVSGSNVINTSNKNLCNGENKNIWINIAGSSFGVLNDNSGLYIILDGVSNYTISTKVTQSKYRVGLTNSYPLNVEGSGTTLYNSSVLDNSKSTVTKSSVGYRYLIINATDLSSIQVELGSSATSYEPHQGKELPLDLGTIELCKIGNYQDYFYKSGGKWYLHKEIGKVILNNIKDIKEQPQTGFYRYSYSNSLIKNDTSLVNSLILFTNYFKPVTFNNRNSETNETVYAICNGYSGQNAIMFNTTTFTSLNDFKTWLATNNVSVYYLLATATDTEITDTTLISQLEAIYNAPLYEETNITQTNNDLPMILDITACKDNINGIKAFIRK